MENRNIVAELVHFPNVFLIFSLNLTACKQLAGKCSLLEFVIIIVLLAWHACWVRCRTLPYRLVLDRLQVYSGSKKGILEVA